jgi:starch phosphorylase
MPGRSIRPFTVLPRLPDRLRPLQTLAYNLWWCWNADAVALFRRINPDLFEALDHSPIRLLGSTDQSRFEQLEGDDGFLAHMDRVAAALDHYLKAPTWYQETFSKDAGEKIAYFSAEFGIHESVPVYSGGLGVLAGDHLKSASDLGIPLIAVGLLYRYGYYRQEIAIDGATNVTYPPYDFARLPVTDTGKTVIVPVGKRAVVAKVWLATVGRVKLYLLDTDHKANKHADDRAITHYLYGGDSETRIRQELILGVGGVMALEAVGETPSVIHLNEGHAAFAPLAKLKKLLDVGTPMAKAVDQVRAHAVFTTHTPVPAGHDRFDTKLAATYLKPYLGDSKLSLHDVMQLGSENQSDPNAPLCMTAIALRLAARVNGVAALHGRVSREMWQKLYGAASAEATPIGHVTNGVHPQTWLAPEAYPLYNKYLKPTWAGAGPDDDWWKLADKIPADELWQLRSVLRKRLIRFVRNEVAARGLRLGLDGEFAVDASRLLDEDTLTIGFARRFATYKRAPLIFTDAKRLAKIVSNTQRPIQFIFAGKAHPKDTGGQAYLKQVVEMSQHPMFKGRVVVLENYDMQVGRMLVSGCDIWLNNPLRPNEASGTSGMKPPLHGGVNLSILDGWWPEGFNGRNGFAIGDGREFADQAKQDKYDAGCIYDLLEKTIAPTFYDRDAKGLPRKWLKVMAESMKSIPAKFSTHRMLADYVRDYYLPSH